MSKDIDIKEFAERVERLCDFFINKSEKNESADLKVIHDLKEDAADIQFDRRVVAPLTLSGLDNHMRGLHEDKKES